MRRGHPNAQIVTDTNRSTPCLHDGGVICGGATRHGSPVAVPAGERRWRQRALRSHGRSTARPTFGVRATATSDAGAARRMLAIALILEGHRRCDAARHCGMHRQTLRDWVHRYNAQGLAGLSDRHAGGPPRRLSAEQEAKVGEWIRSGPNLKEHGVIRWRIIDLRAANPPGVRGDVARAQRGQAAAAAQFPTAFCAPPPPGGGRRGPAGA